MERLTKDNPKENFETMMNYVFAKDGWAHIRHDGESEDVPLTAWAKAQCIKRGCDEFPGETAKEIDETLCDCLMDGEGCPVALAYCFACQASHLRDRLKSIEDILGDVYDLDQVREIKEKTIDLKGKCGSCTNYRRIGGTAWGHCLKRPYGHDVVCDKENPYDMVLRSKIKCKKYEETVRKEAENV